MALGIILAAGILLSTPRVDTDYTVAWAFSTGNEPCLTVCEDGRQNDRLYVGAGRKGILVLDTSERRPKQVATIPLSMLNGDAPMAIAMSGSTLYIATGDVLNVGGANAGLAVIDVETPNKPKLIDKWRARDKEKGASCVLLENDRIYLGAMREGILVFSLNGDKLKLETTFKLDRNFPKRNPSGTTIPNVRGMFADGDRLYVANDAGGLRILDVKDVKRISEIGKFVNLKMGNKPRAYNGVIVDGKTAYCTVDYAGIETLDISDPAKPKLMSWWNPWLADTPVNTWFNSQGHTNQIAFGPNAGEITVSAGDSEIINLDIAANGELSMHLTSGRANDNTAVWGFVTSGLDVYATYVKSAIPFKSNWAGVRKLVRN